MTKQENKLNDWLHSLSIMPFTIEAMQGDASARKYYLLTTKHPHNFGPIEKMVVMHTTKDASMYNFINIAKYLASLNFIVPQILAIDEEQGLILLTYLGEKLFANHINSANLQNRYSLALQNLLTLQTDATSNKLPHMGSDYIQQQLQLFNEWYLVKHLKLAALPNTLCDDLTQLLLHNFTMQPQLFVHCDFHSRNLLLYRDNLAILDFQDAMCGPITYDLVSLLQDAYLVWPPQTIESLVHDYFTRAKKNNLLDCNFPSFLQFFYLTGLQRHLKNLGVFARLKHLYNKPHYITYTKNLLHYIQHTCQLYRELTPLRKFITNSIIPATI